MTTSTSSALPPLLRLLARWEPSPAAVRRSALATVVANVGIAFTGAVVRVTGSGLGCPEWPRCTGDSLVPVPSQDHPVFNMAIEFGNRLLGVVVFSTVAFCLLVVVRARPRRRVLIVLAALLPVGVLVQAVIGGLSVWYALTPGWVTAHFLGTSLMLVLTVWLHVRASEGDAPPRPTMRGWLRRLTYALTGATVLVLVAGTVVTGSGPHAGDAGSVRYPLAVDQVTKVHSSLVWVTAGLLVVLLVGLRLTGADRVAQIRAVQVAGVLVLQAAIGIVQYLTGVPAPLVSLHVLGACLLWVAVLRLLFATRARGPG